MTTKQIKEYHRNGDTEKIFKAKMYSWSANSEEKIKAFFKIKYTKKESKKQEKGEKIKLDK